MDEFALIRQHFASLTPPAADVVLGIGDDAALLAPLPGLELAITTDTLVVGRHFPETTTAYDIGWKSLAVNLSDLAAMGAQPRWFQLSLTIPDENPIWLRGFAAGLGNLARASNIALTGGDTTRGPLSISITAIGTVAASAALRRSGAQPDDLICVTGTLGDAALGLQLLCAPVPDSDKADFAFLRARLDRPQPRVAAGLALIEHAHAAIDLSDGLAGDLQHVLDASGVGAEVDIDRLPMSPSFARVHRRAERLQLQAGGGDDYELCICLPPDQLEAAQRALGELPLMPIGRIVREPGLRWIDSDGDAIDGPVHGYRHF